MIAQKDNPFAPNKPVEEDEQFHNQERVIQSILNYLQCETSCALVGGVGMGKTSVLRRIRHILTASSIETQLDERSMVFVPVYFRPASSWQPESVGNVYSYLVKTTVIEVGAWLASQNLFQHPHYEMLRGNDLYVEVEAPKCVDFERALWKVVNALDGIVPNTKIVFLLDDIDLIGDPLLIDEFYKDWLRLLDKDSLQQYVFRSRVSVVMSSFSSYIESFFGTRSGAFARPLVDPMEAILLAVLEPPEVKKLVKRTFEATLGIELMDEVVDEIYLITGGHPWVMQSALHQLWTDAGQGKVIDLARVQSYFPVWQGSIRWRRMHRWVGRILDHQAVQPLFDLLSKEDRVWDLRALKSALNEAYRCRGHEITEAIELLRCLGLIRVNGQGECCISGRLFLEWFQPIGGSAIDIHNMHDRVFALDQRITTMLDLLNIHNATHDVQSIANRLQDHRRNLSDLLGRSSTSQSDASVSSGVILSALNATQQAEYYVQITIVEQLVDIGLFLENDFSGNPVRINSNAEVYHLKTKLRELHAKYASWTRSIHALEKDIERSVDQTHREIFKERCQEAQVEREEFVAEMSEIQNRLDRIREIEAHG